MMVTRLAVAAVAIVAAVVSYQHLYTVAVVAGESWRAWLLPLSVDGLVIAASLAAFRAKRNLEPVHAMTKLSLATGLVVSLGANVLVPFLPDLGTEQLSMLSATVAAWPALALGLAFEELLRLRSDTPPESVPAVAVGTEALPEPEEIPSTAELPPEPESLRAAALRVAVAEAGITGRKLGEMFNRSDSWGRGVLREARGSLTPAGVWIKGPGLALTAPVHPQDTSAISCAQRPPAGSTLGLLRRSPTALPGLRTSGRIRLPLGAE